MSATTLDARPWLLIDSYKGASDRYKAQHPREVLIISTEAGESEIAAVVDEKHGPLLSSAPELRDALSGLVGLISLLSVRVDLPPELPGDLRSNHRYQTAVALLKRLEERN